MEEEEFINVLFLHLKIFFYITKSPYCNFPLKQNLEYLYMFYGQLRGVSEKLCECFNDLS